VFLHSNGNICVTAHEDGYLRIFDIHNGRLLHSIKAHGFGVSTVSMPYNENIVVSGGIYLLIEVTMGLSNGGILALKGV
jgi:WD40 repeat protein